MNTRERIAFRKRGVKPRRTLLDLTGKMGKKKGRIFSREKIAAKSSSADERERLKNKSYT